VIDVRDNDEPPMVVPSMYFGLEVQVVDDRQRARCRDCGDGEVASTSSSTAGVLQRARAESA